MSFSLPNGAFKRFVVMVDYGVEGWKVHDQTDDAQEAIKLRDEAMGYGNSRVVVFRPAEFALYVKGTE